MNAEILKRLGATRIGVWAVRNVVAPLDRRLYCCPEKFFPGRGAILQIAQRTICKIVQQSTEDFSGDLCCWTNGRFLPFGRLLAPTLLLTTPWRKTGQPRTTPVFYLQDGDRTTSWRHLAT